MDSGGRYYVADAMAKRVIVFDENGARIRQLGRAGEGPGEFRHPTTLAASGDSTVHVFDPFAWRLTKYRSDGEVVEVTHPERPARFGQVWELDFSSNLRLMNLGFEDYQATLEKAVAGERQTIARGRNTIQIWDSNTNAWVDLLSVPGRQVFVNMDRGSIHDIRYARRPLWTPDPTGGFWYADNGRYELSHFDSTGRRICTILVAYEPMQVTAAERQRFYRAMDASDRSPERRATLRENRQNIPVPETKPTLQHILAAENGDVWVHATSRVEGDSTTVRWHVFTDAGVPRAFVDLPSDFTPHTIRNDRVIGVRTDSFDVQYVTVYRLKRFR